MAFEQKNEQEKKQKSYPMKRIVVKTNDYHGNTCSCPYCNTENWLREGMTGFYTRKKCENCGRFFEYKLDVDYDYVKENK